MLQYRDSQGVLRPILATGYQEDSRGSPKMLPYESYVDVFTYCLCTGKDCDKYHPKDMSCKHEWRTYNVCLLSQINEVLLINATPDEWLPTLIGILQTELGIKELEKRLQNIGIKKEN